MKLCCDCAFMITKLDNALLARESTLALAEAVVEAARLIADPNWINDELVAFLDALDAYDAAMAAGGKVGT